MQACTAHALELDGSNCDYVTCTPRTYNRKLNLVTSALSNNHVTLAFMCVHSLCANVCLCACACACACASACACVCAYACVLLSHSLPCCCNAISQIQQITPCSLNYTKLDCLNSHTLIMQPNECTSRPQKGTPPCIHPVAIAGQIDTISVPHASMHWHLPHYPRHISSQCFDIMYARTTAVLLWCLAWGCVCIILCVYYAHSVM